MEQHRPRRIPAATGEPRDVWFRVTGNSEWIHIETLFGQRTTSRAVWTPRLLRWGGLASIVGGLLWVGVVLLQHLLFVPVTVTDWQGENLVWQVTLFLRDLPYVLDSNLLVVPLLLFLFGAVGLYVLQWTSSSRLAKWGLGLSVAGIIFAVMDTLFPFWLYFIHRYVAPGYTGFYFEGPQPPPFRAWFGEVWIDLLIMSIGLTLLGIAALRSGVQHSREMLFFIATVTGLFAIPVIGTFVVAAIIAGFNLDGYDALTWFDALDIFTIMAVLFGVTWIRIGLRLRSEGTELSPQPLPAGSTA